MEKIVTPFALLVCILIGLCGATAAAREPAPPAAGLQGGAPPLCVRSPAPGDANI